MTAKPKFVMMQGCSDNCKELCEFELKITIQKLVLTDKEKDRKFEDISIVLTFESNVIKIENIQHPDENINIEKTMCCQTSPENFTKKLKKSPILINLSRQCMDLGTIRLEVNNYFTEAVLCDEFSSEKMVCEYKFIKEDAENATMELMIEVSRHPVDSEAMKDFVRSNEKRRERQRAKARSAMNQDRSSVSSDDTLSSFMCDADLLNELCPMDDDRASSSKSRHSKSSKCLSDIAASLDVNKFSDNQKTFCHGCRGFSISGVTCENKTLFSKSDRGGSKSSCCSSKKSINSKKCIQPVNRICSECFANLTVLPNDAPCPYCACINKTSKIEHAQKKEVPGDETKSYFHKVLKDILLDVNGDKTVVKKSKVYKKKDVNSKGATRNKKRAKCQMKKLSLPRCNKIKTINKASKCRRARTLRPKNYGVVLGHKDCKHELPLVPKNMGWLWNVRNPGISMIRRGWKPGAIQKSVARTMKCFLTKECDPPADGNIFDDMNEERTSTLKVEKKSGEYKITLNPSYDNSCGGGDTPIVFRISKNEDEKGRMKAKKALKSRGITKSCECADICECCCINECQKQAILCELKAISDVLCLNPPMKYEELNEGSECSEIDFEFTPPFEMMNKCRRDVKVSVAATQYEEQIKQMDDETSEDESIVEAVKKPKVIKKAKKVEKKKIKKSLGRPAKEPEVPPDHKGKICISLPPPNPCQPSSINCNHLPMWSNTCYPRALQNYNQSCQPRHTCHQNYYNPSSCYQNYYKPTTNCYRHNFY